MAYIFAGTGLTPPCPIMRPRYSTFGCRNLHFARLTTNLVDFNSRKISPSHVISSSQVIAHTMTSSGYASASLKSGPSTSLKKILFMSMSFFNPLRAGKYFSLKTKFYQGTGDFVASRINLCDESILVSFVLHGQPRMCEIPILSSSHRIHMLFVFFYLFPRVPNILKRIV